MKKTIILSCFIALLGLSACHTTHPRHPHDGNFCPPGQAKKGNCH
jgi:hypothetical protein